MSDLLYACQSCFNTKTSNNFSIASRFTRGLLHADRQDLDEVSHAVLGGQKRGRHEILPGQKVPRLTPLYGHDLVTVAVSYGSTEGPGKMPTPLGQLPRYQTVLSMVPTT